MFTVSDNSNSDVEFISIYFNKKKYLKIKVNTKKKLQFLLYIAPE